MISRSLAFVTFRVKYAVYFYTREIPLTMRTRKYVFLKNCIRSIIINQANNRCFIGSDLNKAGSRYFFYLMQSKFMINKSLLSEYTLHHVSSSLNTKYYICC